MRLLLLPFAFLLISPLMSSAQPVGGEKQGDGSIAYRSKFGMVLSKPDGRMLLILPNAKVMASIGLADFPLAQVQSKKEGVMLLTDPNAQQFTVSAFFEKVSKARNAAGCRDHYFEYALQSPAEKSNIKRYEQDGLAIGSYTIAEGGGVRIDQRHWNAYAFYSNYCLDAHISKMFYDAGKDEAAFNALASTIAFLPKN